MFDEIRAAKEAAQIGLAMSMCLIKGCDRGPVSRGLCGSHYPVLWALVKLGFISEGKLIDAGMLKASKCLQRTKKFEITSHTGFTLTGKAEIRDQDNDSNKDS